MFLTFRAVYLLVFCVLGAIHCKAQLTVVEVVEDSFPEYVLTINARNPEPVDDAEWSFQNGPNRITSQCDSVWRPRVTSGSDLFFLIENSPFVNRREQLQFFKALISKSVKSLSPEDRVFIAHFDWKTGSEPALVWVNKEGLSKPEEIMEAINGINQPGPTQRIHQTTELFPALSEALDSFGEMQSPNKPGALFLFSREVQNIYNSSPSESDIIQKSRKLDVPVYSIAYPPSEPFKKYTDRVIRISEESWGRRLPVTPSKSQKNNAEFIDLIKNVPSRASGINYSWRISSQENPGTGSVAIEIIAGVEKTAIVLAIPSYFDWVWQDENRRLIMLVLLLAVFLISGLVIYLLKKRSKKRKFTEITRREREMNEIRAKSDQIESQLNEELEKNEREKLQKKREDETRKSRAWQEARTKAFQKRSNTPFMISSDGTSYNLNDMVVHLGRSVSASICLSDEAISQQHAIISFGLDYQAEEVKGNEQYFITDLGSTNGTTVNGNKVIPHSPFALSDNDLILLGNTSLIFRL